MRIEARASKYFNFSTGSVKHCDYCKSSPALLYCKVESAFTCIACDTRAHDGNLTHERVWICEVCEHAPAAFTCKADAAALCVSCDRDIHSANPLASRHERVPVVPFYDTAESVLAVKPTVVDCNNHDNNLSAYCGDVSNDSWMMNSPNVDATHHNNKFHGDHTDLKSLEFLFSSSDQLLDFDNYQEPPYLSDSVVPVQADVKPTTATAQLTKTNDHYLSETRRFEIDFARSKVNSFNNHSYVTNTTTPSHSLSQVSSSSMDVGVVPDGSSISDISNYPFGQNMNLTTSGGNQGLNNMDREARVLRYKEKRKNRKFEKTIRYASRKAYAETRPRIKGRFAKRTDSESELDRVFSGDFIADSRYGVVPSF